MHRRQDPNSSRNTSPTKVLGSSSQFVGSCFLHLFLTTTKPSATIKFSSIALIILSSSTAVQAQGKNRLGFLLANGTPDGLTPGANGRISLCDSNAFETAARAACNTYCYAHDCYLSGGAVNVPAQVCENAFNKFVGLTGEEPPCEKPCPCFDKDDVVDTPFCIETDTDFLLTDNADFLSSTLVGIVTKPNDQFPTPLCLFGVPGFVSGEPPRYAGTITEAQQAACMEIAASVCSDAA